MFRSPELDLRFANEQLERDLRERRLIRVVEGGRGASRSGEPFASPSAMVIRLGLCARS